MSLGLRLILAAVFVVAWNVTTFLMIFVIPGYKREWDDYGVALSRGKVFLVQMSDFMGQWWLFFLPGVWLGAILFVVWPHFIRRRL